MSRRKAAKPTPGQLAEWALNPEYRAAKLLARLDKGNDVVALTAELLKQTKAVGSNDLTRACDMLAAQAHSLDGLFNSLVEQSMVPGRGAQGETLLRLAFKAQSQCVRTLEVLGAIKNPPVVYAKQANIAHNQQVNNGIPPEATRTEKPEIQQNQLLTVQHGETLDSLGTGQASGTDTAVGAVGAVNRAEDGSW